MPKCALEAAGSLNSLSSCTCAHKVCHCHEDIIMATPFPSRMGASWEGVGVVCRLLTASFLIVATLCKAQFMRSTGKISLAN